MQQQQPQMSVHTQQGEPHQESAQQPPGALHNQQQPLEFPTRSHLPESTRRDVIQHLNQLLADTTVLETHVRFAHWNVKGMAFYGLHDLFEEIAEMLEDHVDAIAERITALGGQALGTAEQAVARCDVQQFPTHCITGEEFVATLSDALATHDANLTTAIQTMNELEDVDTADLLNEVSRAVTEALWFLEAHLQTQPIQPGQGGSQPPAGQPTSPSQSGGYQQSGSMGSPPQQSSGSMGPRH